jgi:2-polyprenyl-3-methyl-5-hydroxy-6-metoxy-1,4-benzoquinol methylase
MIGTRAADNRAYLGPRPDVQSLVPTSAKRVLDVGCAGGALGAALKSRRPWITVHGIERDAELAGQAERVLDSVVIADLDRVQRLEDLGVGVFDCIICADVLEHIIDPWALTSLLVGEHLSETGVVVFSLPNIAHTYTFLSLLRLRWPYLDRGIFDKTHVRMFAKQNVVELVEGCGLQLSVLNRNLRIHDRPGHWLNRYARFVNIPILREYFTYQFVGVARRRKLE